MNETLITDLVSQQALDQLAALDRKMAGTLRQFKNCARKLAQGIRIPVEVTGDLERLRELANTTMQRAGQAAQQYTQQLQQQQQIIGRTTAAIAEQLQRQAQANEATRQATIVNREAMAVTDKVLGSLQRNIHLQAQHKIHIAQVNKEMSDLKKQYDNGMITQQQYADRLAQVTSRKTELTIASQKLQSIINADQKIMNSAEGSYENMSQSLVRLKQALRSDDATSLTTEELQLLIQSEQQLSNELKHQDELMGEHHRNVGDYAIALQNGVASLDDLNRVLGVNAATIEGCIEQNKALEDAKTKLDTQDANYAQTLERINAKIAENKQRISDVSDILGVQAHSVEEAEQQNKRLAEALKLIDDRSAGAAEKIRAYNAQIQANKNYIQQNAGSLRDNTQASNALFQQISGLIGVNSNFGASLRSLSDNAAQGGSMLTGMGNSLKAFGKTLLGLLKNPYVLAVTGVVAGFKWFYDYNKGLIEATRQTKFFTGLTGEAASAVRDKVQALADTYGKDFAQTLKAATAISHNMGITADEALDLINKGFAAGGINSEQYLNVLERFAPTFEKMGVSADEFVALAGQIEKAGANITKSMTALGKASMQLRTMNLTTAKSLQAIGIDAIQMSKDIQTGKKDVIDAMQEIAKKMQETGSNSREVAAVMKDLFGARGESAIGAEFIQFLADAKTGTEELLGAEDSLERLRVKEVETETELNNILASLFEMGDDGFDKMTIRAKIWIKDGLIAAIKWVVDLINYFIKWYNESLLVRAGVQAIYNSWRTTYAVLKVIFNVIIDAIKEMGRSLHALGDIVEGVFTLNYDKVSSGFNRLMDNFKVTWTEVANDAKAFGAEVGNNFIDSLNNTLNPKKVELLSYSAVGDADTSDGYGNGKGTRGKVGSPTAPEDPAAKAAAAKAAKEAEKQRQMDLKAEEATLEAKMALMTDYHEKEMAQIRLNWIKKINAIKGEGAKERMARAQMLAAMQHELAEAEYNYQQKRDEINSQNHLAAVKKGSEEEYKVRATQLEKQYKAELREAERTGADVELINRKYIKQVEELNQEYNAKRISRMAETAATEQIISDNALNQEITALKEREAEELAAAGRNEAEIAKIKEKYAQMSANIQEEYAIESAKRQLEAYKSQISALYGDEATFEALFDNLQDIEGNAKLLEGRGLAHEEALEMAKNLASAENAISDAVAEHKINNIDRVTNADKKARDQRIENAQEWVQKAGEAIQRIGEFMSAMYDNQIAKIDELLEAEQEQYDKEVENIEYLAERGAITSEEAEIRKREAAAATAAKQEQLEKKKSQLEYKKAVMEKANAIAQIAINTALGIMQTYAKLGWPAGIPGAIFIGAMGAIQMATALAQPIKAYAEGTKGKPHPGGLALVGDGDKAEVVLFNGKAWVTPDSPTLVDLPKGAEVLPDAERVALMSAVSNIPRDRVTGQPIIINDYSALESRVAMNTKALSRELRQFSDRMAREMKRQKFDAYIARRI